MLLKSATAVAVVAVVLPPALIMQKQTPDIIK